MNQRQSYINDGGYSGGSSGSNSSVDYVYSVDSIENACKQIENGITGIQEELDTIDKVAQAIRDSSNDWKGADANEYIERITAYEKSIVELMKSYQEAVKALRAIMQVNNDALTERNQRVTNYFTIN